MLNGIAPVILFKLYPKSIKYDARWEEAGGTMSSNGKKGEEVTLEDWQLLPEYNKLRYYTPTPIPIYLDEKFTKIAVDDCDQDIVAEIDYSGGKNFETPIRNDLTLTLQASKDNVVLTLVLTLIKTIMSLLSGQRYSITLYYDSMFILDGALKAFSQKVIPNTNTRSIVMILSERQKQDKVGDSSSPIPYKEGADFNTPPVPTV